MTDETVILNEAAGAPVKQGKRWYVTVARPGTGSNGKYSEDVLRETGPVAVPKGTKSFFKHAKSEDRDPRDQVGVFKDGAFWNEEENELGAYLTPFPRYANVLEEAGDSIEASIHVAAIKDARTGNVKELIYNRGNTVDLVAFGGLEGSGLKFQVESLFEAAAADYEIDKKKENNVDITKEMWDAQSGLITTLATKFDTFVAESKQEIKGAVDEAALEAAVETRVEEALASYAETVKAIDAADILTVQKEALKADAAKGKDVTSALTDAVSFVAEAKKELTPDVNTRTRASVVVVEESLKTETAQTYRPGRWSN